MYDEVLYTLYIYIYMYVYIYIYIYIHIVYYEYIYIYKGSSSSATHPLHGGHYATCSGGMVAERMLSPITSSGGCLSHSVYTSASRISPAWWRHMTLRMVGRSPTSSSRAHWDCRLHRLRDGLAERR